MYMLCVVLAQRMRVEDAFVWETLDSSLRSRVRDCEHHELKNLMPELLDFHNKEVGVLH
jgi:hypothetical protein